MLKSEGTSVSMSGNSMSEDIVVANFNGGYGGRNDFYISINVSDYVEAVNNRELFLEDIQAFVNQMLNTVIDLKD